MMYQNLLMEDGVACLAVSENGEMGSDRTYFEIVNDIVQSGKDATQIYGDNGAVTAVRTAARFELGRFKDQMGEEDFEKLVDNLWRVSQDISKSMRITLVKMLGYSVEDTTYHQDGRDGRPSEEMVLEINKGAERAAALYQSVLDELNGIGEYTSD